jgi:Fe2+ transport system protein FeoA
MRRHSLFRMFYRKHHGHHRHTCPYKDCQTLNQVQETEKVSVICNPDKNTLEMGVYPGSTVLVMRNFESEQNLIIAIENGRFIIARNIAERIRIKPIN